MDNTVKTYAGIGSRSTPELILCLMREIAAKLATDGWTLYSGAAAGADQAFEQGCDSVDGRKLIFLPWKCFNGNSSQFFQLRKDAFDIGKKHHATWDRLSPAVKRLMARNSFHILGPDLKTPVCFVLCYTPGGFGSGGTGQALRIARAHHVAVFDFGTCESLTEREIKKRLEAFLSKL